jgi:hypothetical protein
MKNEFCKLRFNQRCGRQRRKWTANRTCRCVCLLCTFCRLSFSTQRRNLVFFLTCHKNFIYYRTIRRRPGAEVKRSFALFFFNAPQTTNLLQKTRGTTSKYIASCICILLICTLHNVLAGWFELLKTKAQKEDTLTLRMDNWALHYIFMSHNLVYDDPLFVSLLPLTNFLAAVCFGKSGSCTTQDLSTTFDLTNRKFKYF